MRSFAFFVSCMVAGMYCVPLPPTILWPRETYEFIADPNVRVAVVISLPFSLAVALVSSIGIVGFPSFRWFLAAGVGAISALAIGIGVTVAAYQFWPLYPATNIQGPFWIVHPGIYLGLLASSVGAMTVGQTLVALVDRSAATRRTEATPAKFAE